MLCNQLVLINKIHNKQARIEELILVGSRKQDVIFGNQLTWNQNVYILLQCIRSKIRTTCNEDKDCLEFGEDHLYCNKTGGANVCACKFLVFGCTYEGVGDLSQPVSAFFLPVILNLN